MSKGEPEGCFYEWEDGGHYGGHTCLLDANHDEPHECGCGVTAARKEASS